MCLPRRPAVAYSCLVGHGTTILSRSTMQPSTPTPRARCFSLLEFAVAVFIVLGHNVFHILPNEVPILFVLGWTLCGCAMADGKPLG